MKSDTNYSLLAWPVTIANVELADAIQTTTHMPGSNALYIFWNDGTPVGQLYSLATPRDLRQPSELARDAGITLVRPRSRPSTTLDQALTVSVVICTRDRPSDLTRCLSSFAQQTRVPAQILVVDNASHDDATRLAAVSAGVDYVREDRPGLDIARNTGALHATGDIVVYTDDDVVLHPKWLQQITAAFDHDDIWAVMGLVLPAALATEAQCVFERCWSFGRGFARKDYDSAFYNATRRRGCPAWEIGAGANMAIRRRVFDVIGLFDERLDVGAAGCSGDSEMWYRILHHGGTCRYEPTAVVWHHHRQTYDALAQQIYAYMSGHTAALLVQYERTGEFGNLRRLLLTMPYYYVRALLRRLIKGRDVANCLLKEEIIGCLAGILYYFRAPRPIAGQATAHTPASSVGR
jgi:glycosyltransferase involved in cell wall biosynthesis